MSKFRTVLTTLSAVIWLLDACESDPVSLSRRGAGATNNFAVTSVSTMVTPAGSTLHLQGRNFSPAMKVPRIKPHDASSPVLTGIPLTVTSSSQASAKLPETIPFGRYDLEVKQNGQMQLITLFSTGAKTDYPVFTGSASMICRGDAFYDTGGELHYGEKMCGDVALPYCTQDGQSECIATASLPAVDVSSLGASRLRSGTTVAGVVGKISDCAADGDTNCIVSGSFAAANTAGLGDKVIAGQTVAGVPGSLVMPDPSNVRAINGPYGSNLVRVTPVLGDCAADGAGSCYVNGSQFKAAAMNQAVAPNIRQGATVAGVVGTHAGEVHSDCASDGAVGCVATLSYAAAATISLADKVLASSTVAGVAGNVLLPPRANVLTGTAYGAEGALVGRLTLPTAAMVHVSNGTFGVDGSSMTPSLIDCEGDGGVGCVTTGSYPSAAVSGLAAKVLTGATVAGVSGNVTLPEAAHVLTGTSYGPATNAIGGTLSLPAANQVRIGNGAFGIAGNGSTPSLADCTSDGATECVATTTYPTASLTDLAAKVLSGQTVAGVTGSLTLPLAANVYSGVTFGSAIDQRTGALTLPAANQVRVGSGAYGIGGSATSPSLADCAADGATGCVAVGPLYAAAAVTGISSKILTGQVVAGVAGNVIAEAHGDCNVDGQTGCVSVANFKAAATSGLASKVLATATVAGVTGNITLPAAAQVYTGTAYGIGGNSLTGSLTLPAATQVYTGTAYGIGGNSLTGSLTLPAATQVYTGTAYGIGGNSLTGSLTLPAASQVYTGTTYGMGGNSLTGSLTLPAASYVASGVTYGLGGTSASGLLTLPTAANVRVGNGSFGVGGTGTVPTLADCASDGAVSCVTTTSFKSADSSMAVTGNIKSGVVLAGVTGSFAPGCSSDGQINCLANNLFKAANISGISTWDLRVGKTLGGVTGEMKTNCRNGVKSAYFNYDGAVASLGTTTVTTGTALDYWDTQEDYYGSPSKVTAWSADTMCDASNWLDVTTTDGGSTASTCAAAAASCQYRDRVSNLVLTKTVATAQNWPTAIRTCASSTYGGFAAGTWRLPTQKELMDIYNHGIVYAQNANFLSLASMQNWFWTSSTVGSSTGTDGWYVYLATGDANWNGKANGANVICVR